MITIKKWLPLFLLPIVAVLSSAFLAWQSSPLQGAWVKDENGMQQVLIFQDGYFTQTTYNKAARHFDNTSGGPFSTSGSKLSVLTEFNTSQEDAIGNQQVYSFSVNGNNLSLDLNGQQQVWKRADAGNENLAGNWKITGRRQDGNLVEIHQTGPRKTLKILSGTRFQWAAINPETKAFFGTGGGTYSFNNGTYTENIEFFSRDSSRVGASLQFEGKLVDGQWHHSGKSSKGDPIYEVWSRVKP